MGNEVQSAPSPVTKRAANSEQPEPALLGDVEPELGAQQQNDFEEKIRNPHDTSDIKEYTLREISQMGKIGCTFMRNMSEEDLKATFQDAALAQRLAERGKRAREAKEQERLSTNRDKTEPKDYPPVKNGQATTKREIAQELRTEAEPKALEPALATETNVPEQRLPPAVLQEIFSDSQSRIDIAPSRRDGKEIVKTTLQPEPIAQETPTVIQDARENLIAMIPQMDKIPEVNASINLSKTEATLIDAEIIETLPIVEISDSINAPVAEQAPLDLAVAEYTVTPVEISANEYITEDSVEAVTELTAAESGEEKPVPVDQDIPREEKIVIIEVVRAEFDDEVADTFEQLLALADTAEDTSGESLSEYLVPEAAIEDETETTEKVEINLFEKLVTETTLPEKMPEVEEIVRNANDQPLKETLIQFSHYLSEKSEIETEISSQSLEQIVDAVRDVMIMLEASNEKQPLSPELTQKLLALLRAVGYKNPGEALIRFVTQHDLEFLLQAVRYLYQLSNPDNQQEFLAANPAAFVAQIIEPVTEKVGKFVFGLIAPRVHAIDII